MERLSIEPLDFQEGNAQSDHDSEVSWHNDSAILHYNQRDVDEDLVWDDDDLVHDAAQHFDPDEVLARPLPRQPSPTSHTLVRTYIPTTNFNPAPATPQDPLEQGKERKTAKPRSRKKKADAQPNNPTQPTEADDEELKSKMLDAIREDDELHHRILRYDVRLLHFYKSAGIIPIGRMSQPIPLQDFLALAVTLDFPIRGLQSKVTKFLDDQVCCCSSRGNDLESSHRVCRQFIFRLPQAVAAVSIYFLFCSLLTSPICASCTLPHYHCYSIPLPTGAPCFYPPLSPPDRKLEERSYFQVCGCVDASLARHDIMHRMWSRVYSPVFY